MCQVMAVAKSGKGGNQEGKSLGKMSRKKASSLCSVEKTCLADQGENEIMDVSQYSCALPDGEAGRIFFESHIPSVMGARFDNPMSAADLQELPGICFLACQAGDAKFNFPRGFVTDTPSPPLKFAFQPIDLR